jgi:hypothetical protein
MIYDKVIEVELEKCRIVSGLMEIGDATGPSLLNIWMIREQEAIQKVTKSYVIFESDEKEYVSEALLFSADFIRLRFIQQQMTKIYIDTIADTYFFDLNFLTRDSN